MATTEWIPHTYQQRSMRLLICRHAFRISIVLHRCLYEILIDCAQDGMQGVEGGIKEHFVGLNFERM